MKKALPRFLKLQKGVKTRICQCMFSLNHYFQSLMQTRRPDYDIPSEQAVSREVEQAFIHVNILRSWYRSMRDNQTLPQTCGLPKNKWREITTYIIWIVLINMKKKKKTHFKRLLAPAMSDGTVQFQKKTYKIFIRYSSLPSILILPIKLKCLYPNPQPCGASELLVNAPRKMGILSW